ncbi:uncharacterized protein DEA37_0009625 [Paragonimus westermani]|uniref:alpha-1,6-mannosyl-glycoprotein 6-beta-N-acetylglucosaminyltransferase n=1 Tax=Paragonimus westermani TaxID=34504 RepID=A0A5J4P1I8_9TREM|nr:uncharacterized protein DEA37_0009625 [Paragonimus westermani]
MSNQIDLIYTDIRGYGQINQMNIHVPTCKLRVLDSFGTQAKYNRGRRTEFGGLNLNLQQFYTLLPHSPDNTFLGFVVETTALPEQNIRMRHSKPIALVAGKVAKMWEQVLVGLGFPYESPAPLEAIANGIIFLNVRFTPPHGRSRTEFFANKPTDREHQQRHWSMYSAVGALAAYGVRDLISEFYVLSLPRLSVTKCAPTNYHNAHAVSPFDTRQPAKTVVVEYRQSVGISLRGFSLAIPRLFVRFRCAMARPAARAVRHPPSVGLDRIPTSCRDVPLNVGKTTPPIWPSVVFRLPCLARWSDLVER